MHSPPMHLFLRILCLLDLSLALTWQINSMMPDIIVHQSSAHILLCLVIFSHIISIPLQLSRQAVNLGKDLLVPIDSRLLNPYFTFILSCDI